MRILLGILTSTLFGYTQAASSTGFLHTFDRKSPQSDPNPQTASPETARLILAQRLGLSQYHSLSGIDDLTLQQLNAFGGEPTRFFGDEDATTPAKLLVLIDGVQDPEGISFLRAVAYYVMADHRIAVKICFQLVCRRHRSLSRAHHRHPRTSNF